MGIIVRRMQWSCVRHCYCFLFLSKFILNLYDVSLLERLEDEFEEVEESYNPHYMDNDEESLFKAAEEDIIPSPGGSIEPVAYSEDLGVPLLE